MSLTERMESVVEKFKDAIETIHDYIKKINELNTLKLKNEFPEYEENIDRGELTHIYYNNTCLFYSNKMVMDYKCIANVNNYNAYVNSVGYDNDSIDDEEFFNILEECRVNGIEQTSINNSNFKIHESYYIIKTSKQIIVPQYAGNDHFINTYVYLPSYYAIYKHDFDNVIMNLL
jgi:NAD-specific glutamate dehydrogenase